MKKYFWWMICALMVITSVAFISWSPWGAANESIVKASAKDGEIAGTQFGQFVTGLYAAAELDQTGMDPAAFQKAMTGYFNLVSTGALPQNSHIITVVDFNKPSREKRLWLIDLANKKLLLNTWVAHGSGSGGDMASAFSDTENSHKSSLGFYVTGEVYYGKHGRSLRIDGMDAGFNASARNRDVVVHAADYVSQSTINSLGRLGRSYGCPAVAPEVCNMLIDLIKDKNMIFITGNDIRYTSKFLDESIAENYLFPDSTTATIAQN